MVKTMRLNPGYAAAGVLLWVSVVLMGIAVGLPNWSQSSSGRAGLWVFCVHPDGWVCASLPDSIMRNGFRIACCVFAVWSVVMLFCAWCCSCGSLRVTHGMLDWSLACSFVTMFIWLCVSWGMWIGVHNTYFKELNYGVSFILCVISSGLIFFGIFLVLWGMRYARRARETEAKAAEIAMAPGLSDEEGRRYGDVIDQPPGGISHSLPHPTFDDTAADKPVYTYDVP